MTGERRHTLAVGRNIGAVAGVIAFLIFGLLPAFHFGSYGTLVILSHLASGTVEPGVLGRIAMVVGIVLSVLSIGALTIITGSVIGTALAYVVDILLDLFVVEKEDEGERLVIGSPASIDEISRASVLSRLSFLSQRDQEIHSIVLIGSTAYGLQEEGSDIDIVIICKDDRFDSFREFLFEKEIEGYGKDGAGGGVEFTVLDAANIDRYFRMGSPFAYAVRNGVVLKDDGYFKKLIRRNYSMHPGRDYFMSAFYENISVQYYGAINKLEKEARKNHCTDECCTARKDCGGMSRGDDLARTVMRMLYVTLPARGYMPLSKRDVVDYSSQVYGKGDLALLDKIIESMRKENTPLYYSDYKRLKPLAARLFREVLGVVGIKSDVLRILKNAARLIRGDYSGIDDEALKKCII
jgi:predicted nucleotidyltransferase